MDSLLFASGTTGRAATLSYRFFDDDGAWNGAAVTANIAEVGTTGNYVAASVTVPAGAVGVYWEDSGLSTNNAAEFLKVSVTEVQAGAIAATSFAAGAIDAAALAADAGTEIATAVWASATRTLTAGTNITLAAAEREAIADALLNRDMATGTDSGSPTVRTVRQALRALRNKWTTTAGTYTVTKEDDVTTSWTSTLGTDAGGLPIISSDPA